MTTAPILTSSTVPPEPLPSRPSTSTTRRSRFADRLAAAKSIIGDPAVLASPRGLVDTDLSGTPFATVDELLVFLHERWVVHYGAVLDEMLESVGCSLEVCARQAEQVLASRSADLYAVLSAHAGHPSVQAGVHRHQQLLIEAGAGEIRVPFAPGT